MANRIVLGAFDGTFVLRVSRPGFNVLTTTLTKDQLAFDSRWAEAGASFLMGYVALSTTADTTVLFGRTFTAATLPAVSLSPFFGSSTYRQYGYTYTETVGSTNYVNQPGHVRVQTDRMVFPRPTGSLIPTGIFYRVFLNRG